VATRVSGGQYQLLVQMGVRAAFMFYAGRRGELWVGGAWVGMGRG